MIIKTRFPCCQGAARIQALESVPREQYRRKCARCGQAWDIERRTVKESEKGRIDILDWEKA